MMSSMRGIKRSLCAVLSLVLLSAVCVSAGKLWGVDVGKKEDKGEFATLLSKAAGEDGGRSAGGGSGDQIGSALAKLADSDLSTLSLSELCTAMIDGVLETLKDEEIIDQLTQPGGLGGVAQSSGFLTMLGADNSVSEHKDDFLALLALADSPIPYKKKAHEILDKWIGILVSLRMDVSDPVKLRKMIRDLVQAAGLDKETVDQVMEIVEHPEILAQQIQAMASDPAVVEQLKVAADSFMSGLEAAEDMDFDDDEMMDLFAAVGEEDPEMMEQMIAELMKDPEFLESLKTDSGTAEKIADLMKSVGGGAGRRGHAVEL